MFFLSAFVNIFTSIYNLIRKLGQNSKTIKEEFTKKLWYIFYALRSYSLQLHVSLSVIVECHECHHVSRKNNVDVSLEVSKVNMILRKWADESNTLVLTEDTLLVHYWFRLFYISVIRFSKASVTLFSLKWIFLPIPLFWFCDKK